MGRRTADRLLVWGLTLLAAGSIALAQLVPPIPPTWCRCADGYPQGDLLGFVGDMRVGPDCRIDLADFAEAQTWKPGCAGSGIPALRVVWVMHGPDVDLCVGG